MADCKSWLFLAVQWESNWKDRIEALAAKASPLHHHAKLGFKASRKPLEGCLGCFIFVVLVQDYCHW